MLFHFLGCLVYCSLFHIWLAFGALYERFEDLPSAEYDFVIVGDGMFYTRGSSQDFDRYAEVTKDPGWSWTAIQPYIRKVGADYIFVDDSMTGQNEKFIAPADHHRTTGQYEPSMHGFHGINFVSLPGFPQAIDEQVIQTTRDLDEFFFNQDMNSGNLLGLGWSQATIGEGSRSSSATSYLDAEFSARENLHILVNTRVTRIISSTQDRTFRTVEFVQPQGSKWAISAHKELILSAGTIGSPQILMNSGIGDRDELEELGITTVHHLPAVGKNMTDHPRLASNWVVHGQKTYDLINQNSSFSDKLLRIWSSTHKGPLVDTFASQLFFARLPSDRLMNGDPASGPSSPYYELSFSNGFVGATPPVGNFIGITTRVVSPTSRGSVTLQSSDPLDSPLIDPGFLKTEFDILTMREALNSAMRFLKAPVWKDYVLHPFGALFSATNDSLLDSYIRNFTSTSAHCVGTNGMSAKDSTYGVVDPDFRIKGLSGIRIVDASVLPFVPSAHTQAPVYIFAERAADLIRAAWETEGSMNVRPLITVCGTTGVGKSDFAIDLALHLSRGTRKDGWRGARIINADSMQVYRGMDIITNKVPEEERQGIEHLLMGFKSPGEQYVVGQWVQDALKEIDETHKRSEVPIVVGGTSYWMHHLIFPNRLSVDTNAQDPPPNPVMSQELVDTMDSLRPDLLALFNNLPEHPPSAMADPDAAYKLYSILSILDPVVANRWHWKDTRKVLRSLGVIKETNKRPSEIMLEQAKDTSASKPRFRTLCFWLYAEQSILEKRLNERVDKMIEQGLLTEIRTLRQIAAGADSNGPPGDVKTDYTLGIYQSIGYKEFHDYLSVPEPSEKMFHAGVERMKLSTRQYAKRQVSWIRNKLLPAVDTANVEELLVPTYLLDATVLGENWNSHVRDLGIQLVDGFLAEGELPDPLTLSENAKRMMNIDKKSME
ncbi:hypothetical protein C0995_010593 [Termitomyces sp. Mi166|nr:hypothetical protein C0995_010593 [Termitomyces sp. Mi166\